MAELTFKELTFLKMSNKVKVIFLKKYYFFLENKDLEAIGQFSISNNSINFDCSGKKAEKRFSFLLDKGFKNLININKQKKTTYIHMNSGIPLIGSNEFGIVDRGSNCIEIKPNTGCNLNCIYCSVYEGVNHKTDVVIEAEYLVEELKKIVAIKEHPVEININPQGEPLLYPRLLDLITMIRKDIPKVKIISINTNGILLTEKLIDVFEKAELTRLNISLNTLNKKIASALSGASHNVDHIKEMILYCNKKKVDVLLAPLLVPSYNDEEMKEVIAFSKEIKSNFPTIGIQNFLNYKRGRNPVKQWSWEQFYEKLKQWEKEYNVELIMKDPEKTNPFGIVKDNELPKPFKKNQIIEAEVKCRGRNKGEMIAVADDRNILVRKCDKAKGKIKVRIIRDKHNVFVGVPV